MDTSSPLYPAVAIGSPGVRVRIYLAVADFSISLQTIHASISASRIALYGNPSRFPAGLNKFTSRGAISLDRLTIPPSGAKAYLCVASDQLNPWADDPGHEKLHNRVRACCTFLSDRPIPTSSRWYYFEVLIGWLPFNNGAYVSFLPSFTANFTHELQ